MLTIQVTCPCGHHGKVTDPKAIEAWKKCQAVRLRCSNCGQRDQWDARLSWDPGINPMAAAFDATCKE